MNALTRHMNHSNLREFAHRGQAAIARLSSLKVKAQEQMGQMVCALEVNASAFAFGFARGYWAQPGQDVAIAGVPIDLAGGILGHAFALFGGLGRYKDDAHNLANGALASYSTTLGLKMGVDQAQKHPPHAAAGYGGYPGWGGGGWNVGGAVGGGGEFAPPQDDAALISTLQRARG